MRRPLLRIAQESGSGRQDWSRRLATGFTLPPGILEQL